VLVAILTTAMIFLTIGAAGGYYAAQQEKE